LDRCPQVFPASSRGGRVMEELQRPRPLNKGGCGHLLIFVASCIEAFFGRPWRRGEDADR
jgi:hypothetical protein